MNGFTDTKKVEEVGTEADKDKKPTLLFSVSQTMGTTIVSRE